MSIKKNILKKKKHYNKHKKNLLEKMSKKENIII